MFSINSSRAVYFSAGLVSILLFVLISAQVSVINPDAICYIQSAKLMPVSFHEAMHLCDQAKWPFYSLLIYSVVYLTHFSFETAAYLLNGFFSLISVLTFIAIVDELVSSSSASAFSYGATEEGETRGRLLIQVFAAITILFAHTFNSVKEYIIRDHGFWAFYLLSIYFLLRILKQNNNNPRVSFATLITPGLPSTAKSSPGEAREASATRGKSHSTFLCLFWSISLILATLFRIEGAIFLICIPFLLFFCTHLSWSHRLKLFIKCNLLTIIIGTVLIALVLIHPEHSLSRLGEFSNQFQNGLSTLINNYHLKKDQFAHLILSNNGARDAGVLLTISLIVWYIINIITNLSVLFTVLVMYSFKKVFLKLNYSSRIVLLGYLSVNIFITSIFLAENLFLSKRYLIALSLVLMLFVPFALYDTWTKRSRWVCNLIIGIMVLSCFGVFLHYGDSRQYIRDAATWVDKNISKESLVYSNDIQVSYYSEHLRNTLYLKHATNNLDYLIIRQADKKNNFSLNSYSPIQRFKNRKGDEIVVYRRQV